MNANELKEGWWYRYTAGKTALALCRGAETLPLKWVKPATLSDLCSPAIKEKTGKEVWFVRKDYQYASQQHTVVKIYERDEDMGIYMRARWTTEKVFNGGNVDIALAFAEAVHAPVICEEQWKELTK